MGFKDLREWLDKLESAGELKRIKAQVDWDKELGAVANMAARKGFTNLLFENIKGYQDKRCNKVFVISAGNPGQIAMILGVSEDSHPRDLVNVFRERVSNPIKPVIVDGGQVKENILKGDDICLYDLPVPHWHDLDGGRYINTGCGVVTRDPENGIMNIGLYRGMIADKNRIAQIIVPSQHIGQHFTKYAEMGKEMPFPIKTWQGVIDIARFFNGKNWDDTDTDPDTGIVMHFKVNEQGMFHFMSLSASFVVMGGDRVDRGTNNYWFDPETMEPLIDQPGHVRALKVLYDLSRYGPRAQSAWDLGTAWDWFLRGKSIFVFSWGDVGALVQDTSRSKIKGKLGASILPGTYEVYDMNRNRWVKLSQPHVVGNTTGGSWHGVISSRSKNPEAVYSFYALMATKPVSLWNVNRGWTGVDPGASIHFLPPHGTADLQGYLDAGWDENDLRFYLKAYHDNFFADIMLPYLRINGTEEYWRALDQNLSETMIGRLSPKEALTRTAKEWDEITNRRGRTAQLKQYRRSIGYRK